MKKLLKVAMIVSFVIVLSACGSIGDLIPVDTNQADLTNTYSIS